MNEGQEVHIKLVVAGRHAAKLLEPAEKSLNGLALRVAHGVVGAGLTPFTSGRNHGAGAAGGQGGHERVGIVAAVGEQLGRGQVAEQRQGLRRVVALTSCQAAP